jgi:exonuclease SbcC
VKRVRDGLEHKYSSLESDIKQLRQRPSIKNDVVQYISIADGSNLSWDVENPNLTDDQYILLLHEGGEIDQLKYFCKNQKAYNDYKRNYYTERYFSDSNLKNIALFVKCRIKSELLNKYKCLEPIVSYRIDDAIGLFNFLSISYSNYLDGIVPLVTWNDIIDKIKTFKELYNSMSEAQKNLSSLVNLRDKLSEQVKDSQNLLQDSSCPLCGHKYKDIDELLSSITHQTEILNDNLSAAGKAASEQFQTIKKNVCDSVISPIVEYFKSEGITPELFANYKKLDLANISRKIKILDDEFQIKIDDTLSETEIFADLRTRLNQLIVELPQDVDYNLLEKAYSTAAKFVNKDCLNEETIEKKRNYLTYCWNGLTYNILQQKQSELTTIQKKLDKAKGLYNRNKKLIDNLREVRGRYIQKVISDIEILFYIYSGRIMQNCLYGRGLFVRSVKKHEYILIASSKNKDDEVDALYNMSSGQLVSVSIALMLSLNKLYSKVAFVAIDDPVQTIDDINFYGLIETLRHDFDKSFMLMSTHEMGYQDLLVYKLRKWNINADKINMAQLFNRGNSI